MVIPIHWPEKREVVIRDPLRVGFFESGPNLRYSEYLISDSPLRGLSIHLYGRGSEEMAPQGSAGALCQK